MGEKTDFVIQSTVASGTETEATNSEAVPAVEEFAAGIPTVLETACFLSGNANEALNHEMPAPVSSATDHDDNEGMHFIRYQIQEGENI